MTKKYLHLTIANASVAGGCSNDNALTVRRDAIVAFRWFNGSTQSGRGYTNIHMADGNNWNVKEGMYIDEQDEIYVDTGGVETAGEGDDR